MTTGTLNTSRTSANYPRRARTVRTYEPGERLDHSVRRGGEWSTATPDRRPRRAGRTGSKQQVSVRGIRVSQVKSGQSSIVRWAVAVIAVLILGVSAIMYLSGVTTEQSFQLADARQRSGELSNQLETLERDVAQAQSSANIAAKASELGMVTPDKPGILEVKGDKVEERRAGDAAATREVIDINGDTRKRGATSNPDETDAVPGLAPSTPLGAEAQNGARNGGVPYADRHNPAPAPAPAPANEAPAPAPAPQPAPAPVPAPENNAPIPAPAPLPIPLPAP